MKKITIVLILIPLLLMSSCKSNTSLTSQGTPLVSNGVVVPTIDRQNTTIVPDNVVVPSADIERPTPPPMDIVEYDSAMLQYLAQLDMYQLVIEKCLSKLELDDDTKLKIGTQTRSANNITADIEVIDMGIDPPVHSVKVTISVDRDNFSFEEDFSYDLWVGLVEFNRSNDGVDIFVLSGSSDISSYFNFWHYSNGKFEKMREKYLPVCYSDIYYDGQGNIYYFLNQYEVAKYNISNQTIETLISYYNE